MYIEVCVWAANIRANTAKQAKSRLTWKTMGLFHCIVDFKSACFFFLLCAYDACTQTWMHILSCVTILHSPLLARALYVMFVDLKLLKGCVLNELSALWGPPYNGGPGKTVPVLPTLPLSPALLISTIVVMQYHCTCSSVIPVDIFSRGNRGRASTHLITCITLGLDTKSALVNRFPPTNKFWCHNCLNSVYNTITKLLA